MSPLLIVANFKSNQTTLEANNWLEEITNHKSQITNSDKKIVVCPSFTLLLMFKQYIDGQNLPIKLGAQDISPFDEGPYTGEINGKQIKEFADYVIIGHSERRSNFNERDEALSKKVEMTKSFGLSPIFCIQNEKDTIPPGVEIIAYEPVFAIGTGKADTPENAQKVAQNLNRKILYGGSVTPINVKNFTNFAEINGVLVGGASLDASEFIKIVEFA